MRWSPRSPTLPLPAVPCRRQVLPCIVLFKKLQRLFHLQSSTSSSPFSWLRPRVSPYLVHLHLPWSPLPLWLRRHLGWKKAGVLCDLRPRPQQPKGEKQTLMREGGVPGTTHTSKTMMGEGLSQIKLESRKRQGSTLTGEHSHPNQTQQLAGVFTLKVKLKLPSLVQEKGKLFLLLRTSLHHRRTQPLAEAASGKQIKNRAVSSQ